MAHVLWKYCRAGAKALCLPTLALKALKATSPLTVGNEPPLDMPDSSYISALVVLAGKYHVKDLNTSTLFFGYEL